VKISYNINDNKGTSQSEEVPRGVKNRGSFGEMSQNQLNDLLSSKTRL
jgi:hypothetical protein